MTEAERTARVMLSQPLFVDRGLPEAWVPPRWIRWAIPFRRRVLHEGKPWRDWNSLNRLVLEHYMPAIRDSILKPSLMAARLRSMSARHELKRRLSGWQKMAAALGPAESWVVWRAIVADYRERGASGGMLTRFKLTRGASIKVPWMFPSNHGAGGGWYSQTVKVKA